MSSGSTRSSSACAPSGTPLFRSPTLAAAWPAVPGADLVVMNTDVQSLTSSVASQKVQLGRGVTRGEIVEHLYRDIRALRIYEGATEVQKLIVGRELLNEAKRT